MAKSTITTCGVTAYPVNATSWKFSLANVLQPGATGANNALISSRPAGTYSNLRAKCSANSTSAATTLRFTDAGANSACVVSITAGSTGVFEDTVNTESVADGASCVFTYSVTSGTGTALLQIAQIDFEPTDTTKTVSVFGANGAPSTTTASATYYNPIAGTHTLSNTANEADAQFQFKKSCTLKNWRVRVLTDGRTGSTTYRLRKNGANANQSISTSATGLFEDTTNTDSIAIDDKVSVQVVLPSGTQAVVWTAVAVNIETTDDISFLGTALSYGGNALSANTTHNLNYGFPSTNTTANILNAQTKLYRDAIVGNLSTYISANSVNGSTTVRLNDDGTNINPQVSVGSSTTGNFSDTSNTATVAANSLLCPVVITGGSTGTITVATLLHEVRPALTQVSTTKTHKYNVIGKVTESNTHKYNVIGKITRTRTHKYNILQKITQTKTHKYNIIAKVTESNTHKYNIIAKLTASRTHKYNILQQISRTRTHKYNLLEKIVKSAVHVYNVIGKVVETNTHKYNIIGKVTESNTHKYNILERVSTNKTHVFSILNSVSKSTTHKYNVLQQIAQTFTHKYNVIGKIVATKTHVYNVIGKVTQSTTHKYNITGTVSSSTTHKYNIISAVAAKTTTHKYNIESDSVVTKTTTHKYNILERVTTTKTHLFDIIERVETIKTHVFSVIAQVTSTKTHKYNIIQRIVANRTHPFSILNTISASKTHLYNVLEAIDTTTTHKYNIIARLLATKTHKYDVESSISRVEKTTTHLYDVQAATTPISVEKTHLFDILEQITTIKTHRWAIIAKITKSVTHKYDIISSVGKSAIHKYNIISKLSAVLRTHRFNILNTIGTTTRTHKYNILNSVGPRTRTHKYNIIGKVTTTKTHRYGLGGKVTALRTHRYRLGEFIFRELGGSTHAMIRFPERVQIIDILGDINNKAIANIEIFDLGPANLAIGTVQISDYPFNVLTAETHKPRHRIASSLIIPPIIDTIENQAVCQHIAIDILEPTKTPQQRLKSNIRMLPLDGQGIHVHSLTQIKQSEKTIIKVSAATTIKDNDKVVNTASIMIPPKLNLNKIIIPEIMSLEKERTIRTIIKLLKTDDLFE